MHALQALIALITIHKYSVLFPIAIFEGPAVIIIAGVLCSTGTLATVVTYFVLLASDTIGSTFYYLLGRIGGNPLIHKIGPLLHIKEEKLIGVENHIREKAIKTILVGKTQVIGGVFSVAAGMSKVPYSKFIIVNFLGSVPRTAILLAMGFVTGRAYRLIDCGIKVYGIIAAAILIIAIVIHYYRKHKRKKNFAKTK